MLLFSLFVYFESNTMPPNYTETDEWSEFVWEFLEDSKKAGIENMISDWELKPFVSLRLTQFRCMLVQWSREGLHDN